LKKRLEIQEGAIASGFTLQIALTIKADLESHKLGGWLYAETMTNTLALHIRQRVERAKLLLKEGKMKILEVAFACGFTDQSHLNRHFKRLTGMTPKNFSKL
jgi:AraC-like DNA-binding protein